MTRPTPIHLTEDDRDLVYRCLTYILARCAERLPDKATYAIDAFGVALAHDRVRSLRAKFAAASGA